jgi:hypothetical protein
MTVLVLAIIVRLTSVLMVWLLRYLYSHHADVYTSENIINIETEWATLNKNGLKILK